MIIDDELSYDVVVFMYCFLGIFYIENVINLSLYI